MVTDNTANSREQAVAAGFKTFNGNPCRVNPEHGGLRYTKGSGCVVCCRERGRKQPSSEYRVKDPKKGDGRRSHFSGYNNPTFNLHSHAVGQYWLGRPVWAMSADQGPTLYVLGE